MRNCIIIILTLLFLAPSMQAHTDVVVENTATHLIHNAINSDELRHSTQHQDDSEDEKKIEHHHHCVIVSFSSAFILSDFNFNFIEITQIKKTIFFYQSLHTSTCSDKIFQPPRIYSEQCSVISRR